MQKDLEVERLWTRPLVGAKSVRRKLYNVMKLSSFWVNSTNFFQIASLPSLNFYPFLPFCNSEYEAWARYDIPFLWLKTSFEKYPVGSWQCEILRWKWGQETPKTIEICVPSEEEAIASKACGNQHKFCKIMSKATENGKNRSLPKTIINWSVHVIYQLNIILRFFGDVQSNRKWHK